MLFKSNIIIKRTSSYLTSLYCYRIRICQSHKMVLGYTRMRIRMDPLIFGLPDPVFFSSDPDPTCNNGYIFLFSFWTKYKPESTNSSLKWWLINSNFMPTYMEYKYYFFFSFRIMSDPELEPIFFFSWAESGSKETYFGSPSLQRHKTNSNPTTPALYTKKNL